MMYHHQLDAGAQPSAVLDSVVSFRLRDQFLALMMSGQQRCGLASPARTVCHGNPALVRQLWDFLSSSATTFFMGIVRASDRSEAEGMSSHCVRLRVSPLTLGIVGDDVTTSNCEYERGECVTHTVFYSKYLSLVNTQVGDLPRIGHQLARDFVCGQCD
ncbi:hypothetical protein Pelo_19651 [Pelomyxa schiedti]|nr:hypothetical protein Pelo_19651 [Pelomyxa schiedti]